MLRYVTYPLVLQVGLLGRRFHSHSVLVWFQSIGVLHPECRLESHQAEHHLQLSATLRLRLRLLPLDQLRQLPIIAVAEEGAERVVEDGEDLRAGIPAGVCEDI